MVRVPTLAEEDEPGSDFIDARTEGAGLGAAL